MKRALLLLSTALAIGVAGVAGSASASAPTTPNGYAGAWNMLQDPTMLPDAGGAMDNASPTGDAGMCRAAAVSSGVGC